MSAENQADQVEEQVEVRVTMFPDRPLRVSHAEARSLRSQGLLVVDEPEDAVGDPGDTGNAGGGEPTSRAERAARNAKTPPSGTE